MKSLTLASALALLSATSACGGHRQAEKSVARTLDDPASARFQRVRSAGDHTCGEVNSREVNGLYGGYKRFVFDSASGSAIVEPDADLAEVAGRVDDPACRKRPAYQTVSERLSCTETSGLPDAQGRLRDFEEIWDRACS